MDTEHNVDAVGVRRRKKGDKMSSMMRMSFALTGPHAGKTIKLRSYQFINGILQFKGTPDEVNGLMRYLGRSYQAYPVGSPELAEAQARDAAARGGDHGVGDLHEDWPEEVPSEVQPGGEGTAEVRADDGEAGHDPEAGAAGGVPGGDGHEDAGLSDEEGEQGEVATGPKGPEVPLPVDRDALKDAIMSLDPNDDSDWTGVGLPRMAALEQKLGSTGVKRSDVEAVVPGWNREAAASLS